jgi:hypothetical protein
MADPLRNPPSKRAAAAKALRAKVAGRRYGDRIMAPIGR